MAGHLHVWLFSLLIRLATGLVPPVDDRAGLAADHAHRPPPGRLPPRILLLLPGLAADRLCASVLAAEQALKTSGWQASSSLHSSHRGPAASGLVSLPGQGRLIS